MLKLDNSARRNDLALRLKYTGIKTKIFKTENYRYRIVCTECPQDFSAIQKDFAYTIANLGLDIQLTEQIPEMYEKELPAINMEQPVDGFRATVVTRVDLEEYIYGRYHEFDIRRIEPSEGGVDFHVEVYVGENTTDEEIEHLQKELLEEDLITDRIKVIRTKEPPCERMEIEKSDRVIRLQTTKEYPFLQQESDFWYQNVEQIYEGKITRQDFSFCRPGSLKCFINASVFPCVNIRNLLLLYDTVYIALPIENFLDKFLENQGMSKNDLVELVSMGKVVLLLGNDERRYDRQVVLDAYKEAPDAVIGRRAMNAMIIAQLVEMKDHYKAHFPDAYMLAEQLAAYGNQKQDPTLQQMSELLAWPYKAVGESFGILQQAGPMAVSNFGINRVVYNYYRERDHEQEIEFEFTVKAEAAHLAMALDATYFPFYAKQGDSMYSDETETGLMESLMQIYWYSPDQLEQMYTIWNRNYSERNMLNLFDTKNNIDVLKTTRMADRYQTQIEFRKILEKLSNQEEQQRKQQIRMYNDILAEASEATSKTAKAGNMLLGCTGFFSLGPKLSLALNLLGLLKDLASCVPGVEEKLRIMEYGNLSRKMGAPNPKEVGKDVNLLDHISPVAIIR